MSTSTTDIGWLGLVASLSLIGVAVAVSLWQRLGLARSILWSCGRAAVQLLIVGFALKLVLDPSQSLVWSWIWVLGMIVFSALTIRSRAPEVPGILPLSFAAMVSVCVISLAVIFGFHIFPLQANAIIPLAGMMIGNSMTSTVL